MNREVIDAIKSLEKSSGELLPEDVVKSARDPESPLHAYFEWDDTEAAHKYRMSQARGLIRRLKTEVNHYDYVIKAPVYVRDPDVPHGDSGYVAIAAVRREEDRARRVMVDEMKRVADSIGRAKLIAIALGVTDELELIDRIVSDVRAKVDINASVGMA